MGGRIQGEVGDLARGVERFRAWRRVRKIGARIPESLWALAVQLAEKHGVNRVASALGLDYYALKKRAAAEDGGAGSLSPWPGFVELPASALMAARECVLEMEDGAGATLRVHLKGYEAADVAAVGRSFWKGS